MLGIVLMAGIPDRLFGLDQLHKYSLKRSSVFRLYRLGNTGESSVEEFGMRLDHVEFTGLAVASWCARVAIALPAQVNSPAADVVRNADPAPGPFRPCQRIDVAVDYGR